MMFSLRCAVLLFFVDITLILPWGFVGAQRNSRQVYRLGYRPTSEASGALARILSGGTFGRKREEHQSNGDSSPPARGGESSQTNLDRGAGAWVSGADGLLVSPPRLLVRGVVRRGSPVRVPRVFLPHVGF